MAALAAVTAELALKGHYAPRAIKSKITCIGLVYKNNVCSSTLLLLLQVYFQVTLCFSFCSLPTQFCSVW